MNNKEYCCEKMKESVGSYILGDHPIEESNGEFYVHGCCGTCYVLKLEHCPFCGKHLSD